MNFVHTTGSLSLAHQLREVLGVDKPDQQHSQPPVVQMPPDLVHGTEHHQVPPRDRGGRGHARTAVDLVQPDRQAQTDQKPSQAKSNLNLLFWLFWHQKLMGTVF